MSLHREEIEAKYVVLNAHTLGAIVGRGTCGYDIQVLRTRFMHIEQPGLTYVNKASVDTCLRQATRQDFADFRVMVPPDFAAHEEDPA